MTKAKIPAQNYTQIPNILLDYMRLLTESEFKVIIYVCRMTFGWHLEEAVLSLSMVQKFTGLGHSSVESAIKKLLARGLIGREPDGMGFKYFLLVDPPEIQEGVPQNSGGSENLTSPKSGEVPSQNSGSPIIGKEKGKETGSQASPASATSKKKKEKERKSPQTDAEWMAELAASPAYEGIDVRREIEKARVWLTTKPGRKFTKTFVVNWLNKIERPLKTPTSGLHHFPQPKRWIPGYGNP